MNGMPFGVCVGNGFIRSETPVNIRGSLNRKWSGNTVGLIQHFSIQYTPNKNVTAAERINPFPTNTYRQIPIWQQAEANR